MELLHARCLGPDRYGRQALCAPAIPLSVDYGGLARAVEVLARLLTDAGIGRGGRVALLAPASPEFVVSLLAVARCGAAVAPMDMSLRGLSLATALDRLAPDAVIGLSAALRRVPARAQQPRATIAFEGVEEASLVGTARLGDEARAFRLPLAGVPDEPERLAVDGADSADDVLLVATSGSTGHPKYVRLGHRGTLFNTTAHLSSLGLSGPFRGLQVLDASYSYGLVASLLATLVAGGTVVLPPRTDARSVRETIEAERPTVCLASPALLDYLIDNCPDEERTVFARLEKVGIGGDRCREPLRRKIRAFMPAADVYVTYGTTEAGPRISTLPPDQFLARPDSVGLAFDGVEIKTVDAQGERCQPGEIGLLRVRTPSRMNGYLGAASGENSGAVGRADGWLAINDLASLDEQGFLTIHGRADRQFKHRGRRINPAQIEYVLERLPGVVAARVEPVGERNEHLRATVHHREGIADNVEQRLRKHCRRNLPSRLVPGEIVTVVENDGYFFKGRRLPVREGLA